MQWDSGKFPRVPWTIPVPALVLHGAVALLFLWVLNFAMAQPAPPTLALPEQTPPVLALPVAGSPASTVTQPQFGFMPSPVSNSEQESQTLQGQFQMALPLPGPDNSATATLAGNPKNQPAVPILDKPYKEVPILSLMPNVPVVGAALPRPPESPSPLFRIGFLRPPAESLLDAQWYQNMRQALLDDPVVSQGMQDAGLVDVALRPCEGPEDMIQRMDQMEFDLVFCPTLVYVLQRAVRPLEYPYHVLLQTRRGYIDSHGGEHVRQRGVLFVRRDSALDVSQGMPSSEAVREFLEIQTLAVSGRFDAAGYFDVRKMLWDGYGKAVPSSILYCGSPEDVVKAVVSGLCDIGACEENVLNEVFNAVPRSPGVETEIRDGRNSFVRVIDVTRGVPSDPVVIKDRFAPQVSGSRLGLALADALKRYYRTFERGAPVLENSSDSVYDGIVEDTKRLQGLVW